MEYQHSLITAVFCTISFILGFKHHEENHKAYIKIMKSEMEINAKECMDRLRKETKVLSVCVQHTGEELSKKIITIMCPKQLTRNQ